MLHNNDEDIVKEMLLKLQGQKRSSDAERSATRLVCSGHWTADAEWSDARLIRSGVLLGWRREECC